MRENEEQTPDKLASDIGELERLRQENESLREQYRMSTEYIRQKVNQLLVVMGTAPLRPEELDDRTLIATDPIGIVSDSFVQILKHLHDTNEMLKITNEEVRAIFDSVGTGILVINKQMQILAYNSKLKQQFFPEIPEISSLCCYTAICKLTDPLRKCPFLSIFSTGKGIHMQDWVLHDRHYEVIGAPVKDESGETSRAVIVYMDITDRINIEKALRRSEEKYRDLFENANDLIQSIGPDGYIQYVNRAWCETLGYSLEEIVGLSIFDIIHPECSDCGQAFKSVVYGEKTGRVETSFRKKSGERIIVEGNISTVTEGGKLIATRGIFRDITARKKADEVIASEREQLAVTLRSIGDGVITTDIRGNVVLMNRVAERLTEWTQEEAAGMPISEVFSIFHEETGAPCENPVTKVLQEPRMIELSGHIILVTRGGKRLLVADSVAPIMDSRSLVIGTVLVFRDVTEKRRFEDRILKAEKIESIGVLAGGIAHDFNNLLNAIVGNIDLALYSSTPGDMIHESLVLAEKAAMRAADLTKQLLTFSRGGAPIKKAAPIAELIHDSADFALRGSNVRSVYALPAELWKAEVDEGQISQVINNLVLNAVQSMPEGGIITISAENAVVAALSVPDLKEGKYVKIKVQDNGIGVHRDHLNRIFEPYFTTKNGGSGLGLATTYSIIKRHGGIIDVESAEGEGTKFYIYLPAVSGETESKIEQPVASSSQERKFMVLLMDDDELIRMTVSDMLLRIGCEVEAVEDGSKAIERYRHAKEGGRPFDAVIMDLTIPGGIGGKEAVKILLEYDPEVKVIVSSGYSSDPIMADYRKYGFVGVLAKPYRRKDLSELLSAVMGGTKA